MRVWLPAIRAGSGADVFTERLAAALTRRGVEAIVSWFPHRSELMPDMLRFAWMPERINVIHTNSAYAFAFKRKGIPLVVTEHHYTLDPAYRPYMSPAQRLYHGILVKPYLRRSYAAADAITTDSLFTAKVLNDVAGVRATRTIQLWVDYDAFSPRVGNPPKHGGVFRLLFVGNASRRKGADVIAPLARRLGAGFEIRCSAGLRRQMQQALADNVRMLGRLTQEQLIQEYRDCDAVLVPSRYEGFGYAALEGMACGKPVVGFRCGAVAEVVSEGKTALLADIDDVDTLARYCEQLKQNPEIAGILGETGRDRAVSLFSESKGIDSYLELYRSLQ
ncbi:MAG: glycosyltransferase family 4 protein [Rudaea sp.]|nr:glycosyltransferase family 4 protein [Rudaea sp.]